MKYYLFKDYVSGKNALFNTRYDAIIFQDKFINLLESNGYDYFDSDYEIEELELNPDLDNWYNSF